MLQHFVKIVNIGNPFKNERYDVLTRNLAAKTVLCGSTTLELFL